MKHKKLIIFDFWQTLADAEIRPTAILKSIVEPIERNEFLARLSLSDVFLKDLPIETTLPSFLHKLGIKGEPTIDQAISMWHGMAKSSYLIPGAQQLIQKLKLQGMTLCLLSNVDKYGYEHFPQQEFLNEFDHIFLSYREGIAKPDPRCWEYISSRSSIDKKDILMIGDNRESDITPAQKNGIDAILIDRPGDFRKVYEYFDISYS